jgi:hypothetical protein
MSNIMSAQTTNSGEITNGTTKVNIVPTPQSLLKQNYVDLTYLTLANNSGTPTLVTLSDGTNDYYFEVGAYSTVKALDNGALIASNPDTNWTIQCGTGVSSLFWTCQWSNRQ